jgi:hypothetical protein
MLALSREKPLAIAVDLGRGASIGVRPATAMEIERVGAEVGKLMVGLLAGGAEATEGAALILGEEFRDADLADAAWRNMAFRRLSLLKLAARCCEEWSGIGDEHGEPLPLNEQNLALALRDPTIAHRIGAAIERPIHAEAVEKTTPTASPSGEAAPDLEGAPIGAGSGAET